MKKTYRSLVLIFICLVTACAVGKQLLDNKKGVVDQQASRETAILYDNLKRSAGSQVLFGHMEDNMNGYSGWTKEPGRSDVFDVTGAYPALYGFDFGPITSFKTGKYASDQIRLTHDRVIEAYKRQGVITFSWHYNNPVSQGSFYWKDSPVEAVKEILPGGNYNDVLLQSLSQIASFAARAKYNGKLIPIIFRPFHEFDGEWFWWGNTHCTTDEYKALYRYTVSYLRDTLKVRNFLYAWSPDCRFNTRDEYTARYPGDAYVDIVGIDDYFDMETGKSPEVAAGKLRIVSDFAAEQHKVAAFTETGLENIPQADWYTTMLSKAIKDSHAKLAYVMVWSNRPKSYWTPYKGHAAEADFIKFKNDPFIIFGDKLKNLYKLEPGIN